VYKSKSFYGEMVKTSVGATCDVVVSKSNPTVFHTDNYVDKVFLLLLSLLMMILVAIM